MAVYGGPYSHEVDAIRDERIRAATMSEEPDFDRIFENVELSEGALQVLEDIKNPPAPVVGTFIENVKEENSGEEEIAAETEGEKGQSEADKGEAEDSAQPEPSSEFAFLDFNKDDENNE